ncbi:MAG: hypothetical protein LUD50_06000 [Clostridia bacterium]|nr:hypothetical protein [Clostridia bacterium]
MRKFLLGAACAALCACTALAFTACTAYVDKDAVNLKGIEAAQIGTDTDCDYYLAAEPAATAKVNAMKDTGLGIVGSLQELYGGEDGYPQAVVVVKSGLLQYSIIEDFLDGLAEGAEWLLADTTEAGTIVDAVSEHLPSDTTPTFNAGNLNKDVIANCAVSYTPAVECKDAINSFMTEINGVSDGFGTANDSFFATDISGEEAYDGATLQVYAPDGAPALGIAYMMAGAWESESASGFEYHVISSDDVAATINSGNADICIMPVNLAVKLLGQKDTYKLTGTITHGNLYLLSTDSTSIAAENLSTLVGRTVGCIQIGNVPGLTFKLILKKNGLAYNELSS